MIDRLLIGPVCLLRGYQLLFSKGLKRYIIIPALVNTLFFMLALWIGFHWVGRLSGLLPHYLHFLKVFFDIVYFLAMSILFAYVFTALTNLIGAPFNSFLSAKVDRMIDPKHAPIESKGLLLEGYRTLKREGQKMIYYLPRLLGVLILFFIPGVNVIASGVWFFFIAWVMAIEYLDYPIDNRKENFKSTRAFIKRHFAACFSFGISVSIAAMIPLVNFVIVPAAVIGGTNLSRQISLQREVIVQS